MKKNYFFHQAIFLMLAILLSYTNSFAQISAGRDTTVCSTPVTLTAIAVPNKGTTTYTVDTTIAYKPDSFNAVTATIIPLSDFSNTTKLTNASDDGVSSLIPIGFTFCYFGIPYTKFAVGTNGWITFTDGQKAAAKQWQTFPIPDASAPLNAIMGPWQDLVSGGSINYAVYGTAPYRRLVVSWYKSTGSTMSFYAGCGGMCIKDYTGQIVIYETTNIIDIFIDHKKPPKNLTALGINHVQGIQNKDGTVAYTRPGRNSTLWPAVLPDLINDAVRFIPNGPPDFTLNWYKSGNSTILATGTKDTLQVSVSPPLGSTDYVAEVIYNCPMDTLTDTVRVTVSTVSATISAGPDLSICKNDSVQLSVNGGGTIRWSPATGLSDTTIAKPYAKPLTTTTYTVSVNGGCAGSGSDTITVNVKPIPQVTNNPLTQSICSGSKTTLVTLTSDVAGTTFSWTATATAGITGFTASGTSTLPVQTISTSGTSPGTVTYAITPTANGCPGAVTNYTVTVNPVPKLTNSSLAQSLCSGSSTVPVALNADVAGTNFSWTATATSGISGYATSGTDTISIQKPINSGTSSDSITYSITLSSNGCTSSGKYYTTVNPVPKPAINGIAIVCNKESTTLTATGGSTYTWNTGASTASITVSPTSNTTYTVTVFNSNKTCSASDSVTVKVNALPSVTASGTASKCLGNSFSLSASGTNVISYSWSPTTDLVVLTDTTVTVTPTKTGTFYYKVIAANPCSSDSDSVAVTVLEIPTVSVADTTICNNTSVLLNPEITGNVSSYQWTPSDGLSDPAVANPLATPTTTTTYTVEVSNGSCSSSDIFTISVNAPNAAFTADPLTGPAPLPVSFTNNSTGATDYLWLFGENATSTDMNPVYSFYSFGTYPIILRVTDAAGCTSEATNSITVYENSLLWVPNAFTPGDVDGLNNVFRVESSGITELKVIIFDRWGELIYEWTDINGGWDGTYKNELAQEGVYVYVLRATGVDEQTYQRTGHVTLLRQKF